MILLFLFGISFAMNYEVPQFETKQAAIYWAQRVEYEKMLYRQIKRTIKQFRLVTSHLGQDLTPENIKSMAYLMSLAERYELVLEIMKKRSVGASFYCGSSPLI